TGIVPELVAHYRAHEPTITCCRDATEAIARLRAAGVVLAAISDGPIESQQAKAKALGVDGWSSATVLTAELGDGRSKPAPEPYLEVQRRVPGAVSYAYVADNPTKDFISPRRLGWRTVRIRRANGLHRAVQSADDVDVEITDLDNLEAALWPGVGGPVRSTLATPPSRSQSEEGPKK
ncbi:MAG: HAD family hydrolase, partial [Actinomycetota bacterium]